jgi:carboxymethylenebutenolidase
MEKISFGAAGLPGYIVGPADAPGVVVLQEWWGITDVIKEQAELISKQGFRCLVPDLYKGKIGVDAEEASHVSSLKMKNTWSHVK